MDTNLSRALTSALVPSHMLIQTSNNENLKNYNNWHYYQGTIQENMCIKINTWFIQILVMKKNLTVYIGREMQTAVRCYDEGMTDVKMN